MITKNISRDEKILGLVPLIIPLLGDRAKISGPTQGNLEMSRVHISYGRDSIILSTDDYEIVRLQILQYFQNIFNTDYFIFNSYIKSDLQRIIQDRLESVL